MDDPLCLKGTAKRRRSLHSEVVNGVHHRPEEAKEKVVWRNQKENYTRASTTILKQFDVSVSE